MSQRTREERPGVTVAQSESHQLHSSVVDQNYLIKVRLPEGYAASGDRYPVLYLLDGDHIFAMATDVVQYLIYGGHIPDLIIASPAYGSKNTPDFGGTNRRNRDLLPHRPEGVDESPGAADFLTFLEREMIPYVEGTYRVVPTARILAGYSYGAVFVLYALLENPALFSTYIGTDGFPQGMWPREEAYAARHQRLPAHVILSSRRGDTDLAGFASRLDQRGYEGLTVEHRRLHQKHHFAVPAGALTRSLVAAFAVPPG